MNRNRSKILRTYVLAAIASVILISAGDAFGTLDIQQVSLFTVKNWQGGVLETNPYEFWCMVQGDGITSVTLETPLGTTIDLVESMGFWVSDEDVRYADLADLRDDFPIGGDYIFSFNGGVDSVTVSTNPVEPTGFANVTYPNDGATNVPLNPTFTWETCAGFGNNLYMDVGDEEGTLFIQAPTIDITQTSWTPGTLVPGHLHSFEIAVQSMLPVPSTSLHGDSLIYCDYFDYTNEILFTTVSGHDLSGWVFMIPDAPDFGYSLDEGDLLYFYSFDFVQSFNITAGGWSIHMPTGLVYFDWPFYFEYVPGTPGILWFALPPAGGIGVYHNSTGEWEILPQIIP